MQLPPASAASGISNRRRTDGASGLDSDKRGPQHWYTDVHGPPAEQLPSEDVGPHLPPGGWRGNLAKPGEESPPGSAGGPLPNINRTKPYGVGSPSSKVPGSAGGGGGGTGGAGMQGGVSAGGLPALME